VLKDTDAIATIAVRDLDVASKFYEGKLGFERAPAGDEEVLSYKSGNSRLLVYPSQYAGTNKATVATWVVRDDIEGLVESLRKRGVNFEHYDFPGSTRQGDIHILGKTKAAWMTDPDGNILALVNG
jgi:catechol 2,3-dioxygenase-like lactoylglutathione lyase family enzyme